jgi:hypothetical protein
MSLSKVPNCFGNATAVSLNWILSLVWILAQLPNRTRVHEIMRYNSTDPDLDEVMLSVPRILNFSRGGDAEGNCWLLPSSLMANALVIFDLAVLAYKVATHFLCRT